MNMLSLTFMFSSTISEIYKLSIFPGDDCCWNGDGGKIVGSDSTVSGEDDKGGEGGGGVAGDTSVVVNVLKFWLSDDRLLELFRLELSSSLCTSGIAVEITSLRRLLKRQPDRGDICFTGIVCRVLDGEEPAPNCPCRIIRRVANVFGDPLKSRIFILLLAVAVAVVPVGIPTGCTAAAKGWTACWGFAARLFVNFNCSTADFLALLAVVDLLRSKRLKSIKLVLGVPKRSEQVCGISTLFAAQLWRLRGVWGSNIPRGVERPEFAGELPLERDPDSVILSLFLISSASKPRVGEDTFVGVEVWNSVPMFRGSIGDIFVLLLSLSDNFEIGEKKLPKPCGVVFKCWRILFGVEYNSSISLSVFLTTLKSSWMFASPPIGFFICLRVCNVQYILLLRWNGFIPSADWFWPSVPP